MPAGVPEPPADCWLHPSVEARDSAIEGRGLFATEPLPAGTVVSRLGGRLVDAAGLALEIGSATSYVDTITVLPGIHLVLPPRRVVGYGNHSCDPSLWHVDAYTLAARRDISPDEEVTVDYATQTAESAFTLSCGCGSPLCRGTVTGDDWQRRELRERYGEHWVPALRRLIGNQDT